MGKKLIIAEKPSLGRNIAAAIGSMQKKDGYLENGDYIVSWAFGHLFSLCDIEDYSPHPPKAGEKIRWTMEGLPCFPEQFRFTLRKRNGASDAGVEKQFALLRSLCHREDVDTIINAGDADREGEIIIRLCLLHAFDQKIPPEKKLQRLWLPDQTEETIREALQHPGDERDYELLASEGFARTYIDWLYGVNLTRYATLREGTLLRVGRVIVPIVRAIYDRDMAIRNFVPGKYYAIVSKAATAGEEIELVSKTRFESGELAGAEALCRRYNEAGATVTGKKRKKDTLSPGKLYSLSKLQGVLGKKYKMSMQESLAILQKLYEEGYVTYPRTNSEYLATAEKEKIRAVLSKCKALGYPLAMREDKGVFDDSKIEAHSALTPTGKIPGKGTLSEPQQLVYATIFRRFAAVFCAEKCIVEKTEITVSVGDLEQFTLKGTVIKEPGWTKYDERSGKDKFLPPLEKGDRVEIDFRPTEKETSPPKHYTIETLNNYLKNPFREEKAALREKEAEEGEKEDDTAEYKAILEGLELGTEATRTGIIDNARQSEYILLKGDSYFLLPGGQFLIESLDRMKIRMDKYKTSELGQALKKVYRGSMTVEESLSLAKAQISEMFAAADGSLDTGFFGDTVGICPLCNGKLLRRRGFYGCENFKKAGCTFKVGTEICGVTVSKELLLTLLTVGQTPVLDGFLSKKTGKSFSAALRLEDGKVGFSFPDRPRGLPLAAAAPPSIGPCPRCGRPVIRGRTAFGCSGYREGCAFRMDGITLSDAEAAEKLQGLS